MEQYISKAAVVAEIERRIKAYQKNFDKADNKIAKLSTDGRIQGLKAILSFIDTLEVKEVDLEKEVNAYMVNEMRFLSDEVGYNTLSTIAKHFFELGIKTKGE